jgi:integrase
MAVTEKTKKKGGGKFVIDFWYRGRRKRETVSHYHDKHSRRKALKAAEARLAQRQAEVANGTYRPPQSEEEAPRTTFSEFADRFLQDYAGAQRGDFYKYMVTPMKAHFGDRPLAEITAYDLDRYANKRGERLKPSSLRKELNALGKLFKMAVRWGELSASPAVDLDKPREPDHKTRWLTADEWQRYLDTCPPYLRPLSEFAVQTGMRLKEIVSLTWGDLESDWSFAHASPDSKTGTRPIPLNDAARKILRRIKLGQEERRRREARTSKSVPPSTPWVFLDELDREMTSERARNRISQNACAAMKRAGILDGGFHTLRHTAASWMVQRGVDLYIVGQILGHKDPAMTKRYAHVDNDTLVGAVATLSAPEIDTKTDTPRKEERKQASSDAAQVVDL